jgi:hypothetical protein
MAKNKKCRQGKPVTFSNGDANEMTYPQSTTNDVFSQSPTYQQLKQLKMEASKTGWSCGAKLLSMPLEKAKQILRKAGLHCWVDCGKAIYGPGSEAKQAILTLANAGDILSQVVLEKFPNIKDGSA